MITIVDYQMGNLRSVQKAFERLGAHAQITSDWRLIERASALVLPGVGAFGDAIRELKCRDLIEPLRQFVHSGKPFLGICLGLQLLFEVSYEGGQHQGLGLLAGEVVRFPVQGDLKVPHMGWNQVRILRPNPLLAGIPDGAYFYFVHSYYARPKDESVVCLQTDYGGPFCAMVHKANVYATQFHPEKSQSMGLKMLSNFIALVEAASSTPKEALIS